MLSIILATMLSNPSPDALFSPRQVEVVDPAIQAELDKRDHTRHYISLGMGSAFVLSGLAMLASEDHKFGGGMIISFSLPLTILGALGLADLSE